MRGCGAGSRQVYCTASHDHHQAHIPAASILAGMCAFAFPSWLYGDKLLSREHRHKVLHAERSGGWKSHHADRVITFMDGVENLARRLGIADDRKVWKFIL